MTKDKYFNRGVMALDSPYIGHVVRETEDKIIVFGEGNDRYDIPKSEIQMTSKNVLIGLNLYELAKKYKVRRDQPLPTSRPIEEWTQGENIDLATYERKYPKGLFNKGVRVLNEDHVGHVMKETDDKIVIFGDYNYRFDVPKSKIKEVGRNVILNMYFPELAGKYNIDRNAPLSTGESVDTMNGDTYTEDEECQHGPPARKVCLEQDKENPTTITKSIANMIMGGEAENGDNIYYSKNKPSPTFTTGPK